MEAKKWLLMLLKDNTQPGKIEVSAMGPALLSFACDSAVYCGLSREQFLGSAAELFDHSVSGPVAKMREAIIDIQPEAKA
jgi:hypothetical protein